jgi:hypothetical protein
MAETTKTSANKLEERALSVTHDSNDQDDANPPYRYKKGSFPEQEAFFISHIFFWWAQPLFSRAAYLTKHGLGLEHDDLLPLPVRDLASHVGPVFEDAWEEDKKREMDSKTIVSGVSKGASMGLSDLKGADSKASGRIGRALLRMVGRPFWVAGLIKLVNTLLQFSYPILLNQILKFIQDMQAGRIPHDAPGGVRYKGYWLACILFVAMMSKAMTENAYYHRVYRAGYQSRVAISVAVYNKSLRLANAERQSTTLGELINLMQVDATKIEMFVPQFHVLWDGILQIVGYMAILYTLIGWTCFVGLVVMLFAGPVQGFIMKRLFALNHRFAKHTDSRVKSTNEALQGIQSVKMVRL